VKAAASAEPPVNYSPLWQLVNVEEGVRSTHEAAVAEVFTQVATAGCVVLKPAFATGYRSMAESGSCNQQHSATQSAWFSRSLVHREQNCKAITAKSDESDGLPTSSYPQEDCIFSPTRVHKFSRIPPMQAMQVQRCNPRVPYSQSYTITGLAEQLSNPQGS
jgi:hypothetical protein